MPVFLFLFSLVAVSFVYSLYKQSRLRRLGVPGPFPIPFLGSITLHRQGLFRMDEYLRKNFGNFFGFYIFNTPHLGVADADMIKEICVNQNCNFPNRAAAFYMGDFVERSVSITKDDHWRFTRAHMDPMFTASSIAQFMPKILTCANHLTGNMRQNLGSTIEAYEIMSAYTMNALLLCGFGVEVDSLNCPKNPFVTCAKGACVQHPNLVKQIVSFSWPEVRETFKDRKITDLQAVMSYKSIVQEILETRQRTGERGADFLQLMLETQTTATEHAFEGQTRGLNDDEILRNGLTLILAGHGTTTAAVTWCVYCLVRYPVCQERIRQEIGEKLDKDRPPTFEELTNLEYLEMFVCETLRMFPPPTRFTRNTSRDTEVCGRHFKQGVDLSIPVYSIHHDPEKWQDPETFNPERFSPENRKQIRTGDYVPFGMGPRCCIGQQLGRILCKVAIFETVKHFRLTLDPSTKDPPGISKGLLIHPATPIYLGIEELEGTSVLEENGQPINAATISLRSV